MLELRMTVEIWGRLQGINHQKNRVKMSGSITEEAAIIP